MLLVAGGYNVNGSTDYLSSTEILLPGYSYWSYAASLPVPVAYTASVSLHNIYLIGEILSVNEIVLHPPLSAGNSADYTSSKTVWE